MSREEEFKKLNTKVLDGSARQEELERWQQLKDEFFAANQPERDKRRYQRSPVSLNVTFTSDEELIRAVSKDLGAGGIGLTVAGSYAVGAEYLLSLSLPGSTASVRARVAWEGGGHVGLEFIDVPQELQDRFDALVWEEIDLSDL